MLLITIYAVFWKLSDADTPSDRVNKSAAVNSLELSRNIWEHSSI